MPEHRLKIAPDSFAELVAGTKIFEIRRDDGFDVGDILCLCEWDAVSDTCSGRTARRRVSHILRNTYWLPASVVIMALIDVYGPDDRHWTTLHKQTNLSPQRQEI